MKTIISIACLLVVACSVSPSEARLKRQAFYTVGAPVAVAAAAVPVVKTASVVHSHPTTVVSIIK